MVANPRAIAADTKWFPAKYPGSCASCGTSFDKGDQIAYLPDNTLIAQDCCPNADIGESASFDDSGTSTDRTIPVMPKGKSKADACGRCFLIHSSSQVDCE